MKNLLLILTVTAGLLFYLSGCRDNPSDVGLEFISNDTLGTLILDSERDSILLVNTDILKYINTQSSTSILVGKYQNYNAVPLLLFQNISSDYDSATVLYASLNLKYNGYYYQDSMGLSSFNIYRVNKSYDLYSVTYDKFSFSDLGNTVVGNYTGTPVDTQWISIVLDNQLVKDWLEYAADTNYTNKNYGIALVPNTNSTTIKGFSSIYTPSTYSVPYLKVVLNKNSNIDTILISNPVSVSLCNVTNLIIPQDRFILQSGISYKNKFTFNLTKLPSNVIINEAYFEITLDRANSFLTGGYDSRVAINMITDSTNLTIDPNTFITIQLDSIKYAVRLNYIFQKWNYGTAANFGILLSNIYEYNSLDKYLFYGPNYPDPKRRPHLRIRYTKKN
ncbi:MAG: DNRLRE domain-containing protein [Ignavibacteria bacterium]